MLAQNGEYDKGLIVKDFSHENVTEIAYQQDMDLHIACDFNVDPMSWVLAHKTDEKVFFFDEIIMENTTTAKACDEFCYRYPKHQGKIIINGDASGDNRSCTSEFTNYVIIKKKLERFGYEDIEIKIKAFNPPIKNRVMAFNSKVRSADGEVKLVDKKCEKLLYNIYNLNTKKAHQELMYRATHKSSRQKNSNLRCTRLTRQVISSNSTGR